MALSYARLLGQRQLNGRFFCGIHPATTRFVSIKASPVAVPSSETYEERNARLKRPQSPHLTIYKPQLTSMLSITHRITGMAMGACLTTLGVGALLSPVDMPFVIASIENMRLSPALILAAKYLLAFPVAYHFVNGIRHLAWDTGRFLTLKEVYITGYAMLAISLGCTAWLVSL